MTRTPRIVPDDADGRADAISVLRSGGIVALPTDTVYGIAVSLDAPDGIERLFHVKRRPPEKGIALLLADPLQAESIAILSDAAKRLAAAFWPGPLTLVLPRRTGIDLPSALTGGAPTVGVRLPDHPVPRALAAAIGPLPTTSANLSGEPDALDAATVVAMLGGGVDLVLDGGPTRGSVPSTVVDCTVEPPVILREGALGRAEVLAALEADP
jgi:L-threonylcarbamoyladenylate synthase